MINFGQKRIKGQKSSKAVSVKFQNIGQIHNTVWCSQPFENLNFAHNFTKNWGSYKMCTIYIASFGRKLCVAD